ncbi:hypothetical protein KAZ57_00960 [Patescibacteria group bacterium]|nr:hypothetical protein [Patescibacteria group bacterium]
MVETLDTPIIKEPTSISENTQPHRFRSENKQELIQQSAHKTQTGKWEVYLNSPMTEQEDLERKEIIASEPRSVLVVCYAGKNRSKFIAQLLNERGYVATNIGAGNTRGGAKPLTSEDILKTNPEAIICMNKYIVENFEEQAKGLGIYSEIVEHTPIRTIGFGDNSAFYEADPELKQQRLAELKGYAEKVLDRLGFVKVQHSATPNSLK